MLIHSDQGSQFTRMDWAAFLRAHNLEHSMSRCGNCHDNAVAESFFNLLKREWIRRRTYRTREEARQDVFDYIERFYNPKRKHAWNGMLSHVDFEQQQKLKHEGVLETRAIHLEQRARQCPRTNDGQLLAPLVDHRLMPPRIPSVSTRCASPSVLPAPRGPCSPHHCFFAST